MLPAYAEDFGLTLPWVGVMLSAKRFVRVFAYGAIARLSQAVGAMGVTVSGALVMLLFRGALAALGPAVITQSLAKEADAVGPLARMQVWRDLGAGFGPLLTGFMLTIVFAEFQHGVVAIALALGLVYWMVASKK